MGLTVILKKNMKNKEGPGIYGSKHRRVGNPQKLSMELFEYVQVQCCLHTRQEEYLVVPCHGCAPLNRTWCLGVQRTVPIISQLLPFMLQGSASSNPGLSSLKSLQASPLRGHPS